MAYNYLNKVGLNNLWGNIKAYITSKLSSYATKTENSLKANDADVVHIKTTESITGRKNFDTTNGYYGIVKRVTDYATGDTPTSNVYQAYPIVDKNNANLGILQYASRTTGVRDLSLYVYADNGSTVYGVQVNTNKEFKPIENNTYSLGSTSNKWANVYATNFTGDLVGTADKATADASGNTITSTYATKSENAHKANDADVVHTSGDETISGNKAFTANVINKITTYAVADTPSSNIYSQYRFLDKDNANLGYLQYASRPTGVRELSLFVHDKDSALHGIRITSDNYVIPIGITYCLGSPTNKWANVYATNFTGDLVGNATTATSATKAVQDASGNTITSTYATKSENALKANDADVVHLANTETITGLKYFTTDIYNKNKNTVVAETPTTNQYISYRFIDNNNDLLASLQYANRANGSRDLVFYLITADKSSLGVVLNSDKIFYPLSNNSYLLGSSKAYWKSCYATTINTSILNIPQNAIVLAFCSSAVNNGSTVAGTVLKVANGGTGGSFTATAETLTGTYRALNTVVANGVGMFVKIA